MADNPLTGFYQRDGGTQRLTDQDRRRLKELVAEPQAVLWLDIHISAERDGAVLSEAFNFHPLTIEDCVQDRLDPPKIDDHGEYLFLVVHALSQYDPARELEPVEVDLYLGPNYVVSCHHEPVTAIDSFGERVRRGENDLMKSAAWVLHGLLDALVDEYLPIVDAVDETIDSVEEQILRRPAAELLQQIMNVKRNSLRLRRATVPQREIMNRLSRGEFPRLIHEDVSIYYRDVYDHLVRVEFLIDALRDLADGALNTYLSVVSNRLNEVVRVLTAVGTLFLPGALIAGIYGTNFPPGDVWPPYDSDWGFWAVVGATVAVTLGLLAYLRVRRML